MPNIKPDAIKMLMNYMKKNLCDIATLASDFDDEKEIENNNNVKVLTKNILKQNEFETAIDFLEDLKFLKPKKSLSSYRNLCLY